MNFCRPLAWCAFAWPTLAGFGRLIFESSDYFSGTVLRRKKTLKFFLKVGSGKVDITGGLAWCVFAWPTLGGFGRLISRAPFYDEKNFEIFFKSGKWEGGYYRGACLVRLCLAYAGWIRTSDFSGTVLRRKKTLKFFLKVGSGKVDFTGRLPGASLPGLRWLDSEV